jgi:hypothetical protein
MTTTLKMGDIYIREGCPPWGMRVLEVFLSRFSLFGGGQMALAILGLDNGELESLKLFRMLSTRSLRLFRVLSTRSRKLFGA